MINRRRFIASLLALPLLRTSNKYRHSTEPKNNDTVKLTEELYKYLKVEGNKSPWHQELMFLYCWEMPGKLEIDWKGRSLIHFPTAPLWITEGCAYEIPQRSFIDKVG